MKFFFKRLALFLLPLVILLTAFDYLYTAKAVGKKGAKPHWAMNRKNESYDFVVSGSSRAENILDILTIENATKTKGLNLAYTGSALAENYITLYRFLENRNKIGSLVLSVDEWGLINPDSSYSYPFHEYFFLPFLNDRTMDSVIKDNSSALKYCIWKYLPFIRYSEFNHIYKFSDFFREDDATVLNRTKGSSLLDNTTADSLLYKKYPAKIFHIEKKPLAYLDKIIELCRSNNVRLLFYSAPVHHLYRASLKNRSVCKDTISSIAKRNGITYWDFSDCSWLPDSMYYNTTHLNRRGALAFSKVFADSLGIFLSSVKSRAALTSK